MVRFGPVNDDRDRCRGRRRGATVPMMTDLPPRRPTTTRARPPVTGDAPVAERELRVGVVGAGWAAGEHAGTLIDAGGTSIVGVVDLDPGRAADLADRTSSRVFPDVDTLLGEQPDALVVTTPPGSRRDVVVDALERGIAVFTEKPISRTLDEARAIVDASERTGVTCAIGYQWRAVGVLADLDAQLAGQQVGVLASRGVGISQVRDWYHDPAQSGGLVSERGTHHIDIQRRVAGEVRAVQAVRVGTALSARPVVDGERREDAICLLLEFVSGAVGTVVVVWATPEHEREQTLTVVSSDGSYLMKLDPDFTLTGHTGDRPVSSAGGAHPFAASLTTFLDAVRQGDPTAVFCTPRQAAGSLAVALACADAFEQRCSIPVTAV